MSKAKPEKPEVKVRRQVSLVPSLWKGIRVAAAERGVRMSEVIEEAVRKHLGLKE